MDTYDESKNIDENLENSKDIIKMLNEYVLFFNSDNNSYGKTFFDGIELQKMSSTNLQMEEFYNHMRFYKENKDTDNTKVFENLTEIQTKKGDILYGIFKESNIKCVAISYSLFAILIEIVNIKNIKKNNKYFIKELNL